MPVEDETMKNSKRILTGFAATLWMFMGTDVMGQGSLTPPGAPGETMKTLAQVEPRTLRLQQPLDGVGNGNKPELSPQ